MSHNNLRSSREQQRSNLVKHTILPLAAVGLLGLGAKEAVDIHDENVAFNNLPACEVVVQANDSIIGIENRLGNPRDNEGMQLLQADRHTPATIHVPQFDVKAGMVLVEPHVDPTVCMTAGGDVGHSTLPGVTIE